MAFFFLVHTDANPCWNRGQRDPEGNPGEDNQQAGGDICLQDKVENAPLQLKVEDQLRIIAFEKDVAWLTGARAKEARAIRRRTFNLTSFIHGLRNGRVVVLHCVLSQLQSIQAADRLISSGPVEHDIVHVVAPCKKRLKSAGSNKAAPVSTFCNDNAWAQCDFWNPWVFPSALNS